MTKLFSLLRDDLRRDDPVRDDQARDQRGRAGRLRRETKGAVYVEFLAAFLPIFLFFLALVQLAFIWTADLVVKHAATIGVRQAVVTFTDPTLNGGQQAIVEEAARFPIQALGNAGSAQVEVVGQGARDGIVTVTVRYNYACRVPGGSWLTCGGATKTMEAQASLPNQGVDYIY